MNDHADAQLLAFKLELELSFEAIHGILEHPDGTRQPFWGWLELMAELEHVPHRTTRSGEAARTALADP